MADRFFIAPFDTQSGLTNNVRPWLIPDEAFAQMENAYVFRGRVRKRAGSRYLGNDQLSSRLRFQVGVLSSGARSANVRALAMDASMPTEVGQAFSVGDIVFTVFDSNAGPQQMKRTDNSGATATYNLTNSDFNITGVGLPDGTAVYFYPAFPVMGLLTKEEITISEEFVIAFDTRWAYQYVSGWERLNAEAAAGDAVWRGSNADFFWGTTWSGTNPYDKFFFVSNFNPNEPNFMRYYNPGSGQWNQFRPQITSTPAYLISARIIVPFKNRLLALNTFEGGAAPGNQFTNRCRYSQIGSPLDANAWREDIPGRGNALDAPTSEAIVTVEFVKDRLIVYFERSTWELVYTGNQALPFAWQQINNELGAESTFSVVGIGSSAVAVGNVGVHKSNGSTVERIDQKIPNLVFNIHNAQEGIKRVYGIRDYQAEVIYWAYVDENSTSTQPYPTKVLLYNYVNDTWAINDDSITCFGYFWPSDGILWSSRTVRWADDVTWGSGLGQEKQKQVVAGNQEGYTFIVDWNVTTNTGALQITDVGSSGGLTQLTIIDHNLRFGDYLYIDGCVWSDSSNGLNGTIVNVLDVIDENTVTVADLVTFTGTYSGGGTVARVSRISIKTKEFNFYAKEGRQAYISKVEFMVDKTGAGQIQTDFYVSTSSASFLNDSSISGALVGTGVLDTFAYNSTNSSLTGLIENSQSRLWHPVYFQASGEVIQLELRYNDVQMRDISIQTADFQLHAMCFTASAIGTRL